MLETIARRFEALVPEDVDWWSIRICESRDAVLRMRQGVLEPPHTRFGLGAMVIVAEDGGSGYAATADLSDAGLRAAGARARALAACAAVRNSPIAGVAHGPAPGTRHLAPAAHGRDPSLSEQIEILELASERLRAPGRPSHPAPDAIVDWQASLRRWRSGQALLASSGGYVEQHFEHFSPGLSAVANDGSSTQRRSFGEGDHARQGGWEALDAARLAVEAERVAEQALELLYAPPCPSGVMDVLLTPSQMVLQIHESIGHPLELDRILGDERNYAGGSFVTLDMIGAYRYGSPALNVTFDPTIAGELTSYAFDDEGTPAARTHLIEDGILRRVLGSASSGARAGVSAVANARASGWNRPAIDRMANLNVEPGAHSMATMVESVERGVLMDTNRSWSIDDQRNKFQFGCEYARLIEDGALRGVVRDPGYRGRSADFWRSLARVGDASTFEVLSTLYCGKGEPNQGIAVGHASPACLFHGVEVCGD